MLFSIAVPRVRTTLTMRHCRGQRDHIGVYTADTASIADVAANRGDRAEA